jgi:hypothetical protein
LAQGGSLTDLGERLSLPRSLWDLGKDNPHLDNEAVIVDIDGYLVVHHRY